MKCRSGQNWDKLKSCRYGQSESFFYFQHASYRQYVRSGRIGGQSRGDMGITCMSDSIMVSMHRRRRRQVYNICSEIVVEWTVTMWWKAHLPEWQMGTSEYKCGMVRYVQRCTGENWRNQCMESVVIALLLQTMVGYSPRRDHVRKREGRYMHNVHSESE